MSSQHPNLSPLAGCDNESVRDDLKAYQDRELSLGRRLVVRAHLLRCTACREEITVMQRTTHELRIAAVAADEALIAPLPPALRARLLQAARDGVAAATTPPPPFVASPAWRNRPLVVLLGAGGAVAATSVFVVAPLLRSGLALERGEQTRATAPAASAMDSSAATAMGEAETAASAGVVEPDAARLGVRAHRTEAKSAAPAAPAPFAPRVCQKTVSRAAGPAQFAQPARWLRLTPPQPLRRARPVVRRRQCRPTRSNPPPRSLTPPVLNESNASMERWRLKDTRRRPAASMNRSRVPTRQRHPEAPCHPCDRHSGARGPGGKRHHRCCRGQPRWWPRKPSTAAESSPALYQAAIPLTSAASTASPQAGERTVPVALVVPADGAAALEQRIALLARQAGGGVVPSNAAVVPGEAVSDAAGSGPARIFEVRIPAARAEAFVAGLSRLPGATGTVALRQGGFGGGNVSRSLARPPPRIVSRKRAA
jgi:hypothetical protein